MKKDIKNAERNVIYGLKKIPISQKRINIANLFKEVSNDYDKMNDIMSLGAHRIWKKDLVDRIRKDQLSNDCKDILDLAGGTGDIAFEIKKRFKKIFTILSSHAPKISKCDRGR